MFIRAKLLVVQYPPAESGVTIAPCDMHTVFCTRASHLSQGHTTALVLYMTHVRISFADNSGHMPKFQVQRNAKYGVANSEGGKRWYVLTSSQLDAYFFHSAG